MGRMRYPSLSIHGIDGGRVGSIIPRKVTGRFSLRCVAIRSLAEQCFTTHVFNVETRADYIARCATAL